MKSYFKQATRLLSLCLLIIFISSCEEEPITLAIHDPIQPAANSAVDYKIIKATSGTINSANLYETVSSIDASGTVTLVTAETLLNSWSSPTGDLSFTKSAGYPANSLINYRWEVRVPKSSGSGEQLKNYNVTYATRPYPVTNEAAPVYIQGDIDDVFDVVFIPDTDVTNMTTFRNHCRDMIKDAFFDEPTTQTWRKQFNFYINPFTGTATDFDNISVDGLHVVPSNNAQISFAEGRCLMHQNNLRDYASGGLFSTEMQNRGTVLHESGHALFDLADEYAGGSHFEDADFGNMWDTEAEVNDAADDYGSCKSTADKNNFDGSWWKLCDSNCQLLTTGLNHTQYDCPCAHHILFKVLDNAIN